MMSGCNLRTGKVEIMIHHVQGGMPEYLPERKDIPAVE